MTWEHDLESPIVRAHPAYRRFKVLCADDFPEPMTRDAYRVIVAQLAASADAQATEGPVAASGPGQFMAPQALASALAPSPSLIGTLGNAAGAAVRFVSAFVHGRNPFASAAEQDRRLGICTPCDQFESGPPMRCRSCKCFLQLKTRLETEEGECPLGKWRKPAVRSSGP